MTDTEAPRRRRTRSSDGASSGSRGGRRPRASGDALVTDLVENVDRLLAENRDLKRQLARLQRSVGTGDLGQSARTLAGLQRRVSRALDNAPGGRQARTQPRRKVTDPDVLEKRRAALAKARAARAEKRAQNAAR
jgi:cell division septum initiation protein DivIVA